MFYKKKFYLTPIVFIIFFAALTGHASAAQFTGNGSAAVINGDEKSAQKIAYQAALKKAISNALLSLIQKGTQDELNFNAKKAELLKGPTFDFITHEKEIEHNLNDKLLTLQVQIFVDEQKLKKFLGQQGILASVAQEKNKQAFPSVMVVMAEEINGKINSSPYSARVVRQKLMDGNFDVVDEKLIEKSIKHDQAVQAVLNDDLRAAKAVALQYGAGVVITGKAVAQQSNLKSGAMEVQGASIMLEAIQADSGKVLASASAEGHFPHINVITGSQKALEDAAQKAVSELMDKLNKNFLTTTQTVLVSISDINFKQLSVLKKILMRDFKEISGIDEKSFNGRIAKLDIAVDSPISEFAETIALHDFGTFKLEVINYSPGKVDFTLKMKPPPQN